VSPTEALRDNQAVTPIRLHAATCRTPCKQWLLLCLLISASAPRDSYAQGRTQITFDGPPILAPDTGYLAQQYSESGVWCRPLGTIGPGNGFDPNKIAIPDRKGVQETEFTP
jgi:hypothetical protein